MQSLVGSFGQRQRDAAIEPPAALPRRRTLLRPAEMLLTVLATPQSFHPVRRRRRRRRRLLPPLRAIACTSTVAGCSRLPADAVTGRLARGRPAGGGQHRHCRRPQPACLCLLPLRRYRASHHHRRPTNTTDSLPSGLLDPCPRPRAALQRLPVAEPLPCATQAAAGLYYAADHADDAVLRSVVFTAFPLAFSLPSVGVFTPFHRPSSLFHSLPSTFHRPFHCLPSTFHSLTARPLNTCHNHGLSTLVIARPLNTCRGRAGPRPKAARGSRRSGANRRSSRTARCRALSSALSPLSPLQFLSSRSSLSAPCFSLALSLARGRPCLRARASSRRPRSH